MEPAQQVTVPHKMTYSYTKYLQKASSETDAKSMSTKTQQVQTPLDGHLLILGVNEMGQAGHVVSMCIAI